MSHTTTYSQRLERKLLPWFLLGTMLATHLVLSYSEDRVESRYEQTRWAQIERPLPSPR